MKLQELSDMLQTLCHDGFSQKDVLIDLDGYGVHLAPVEQVKLKFESSAMADGYISVKMGNWKNYDHR